MYIDRKEKKYLEKILDSNNFEFIVMYWRRRIWKTTLIKKIISDKNWFYYLWLNTGYKEQLNLLKEKFSVFLNDKILTQIEFKDFISLFEYIINKIWKEKKIIISLDEFQYFFYKKHSVLSEFQYIIDELLKYTKIKIILFWSSISMIENNILWYKSPLYWRKTAVFELKTFNILDFSNFFPKYNFVELIEIYSVLNWVPYYANLLDNNLWVLDNIEQNIIKNWSIFLEEVTNILKYEITEFRTYFVILSRIALWSNKFSEISSKTWIEKSNLTKYLYTLQEIRVVQKETPILDNALKSKKWLYKIDDLFIKFWFNFIWWKTDEIEFEKKYFIEELKKKFDYYVSQSLDKIIYNYIRLKIKLNFPISKIWRQWDKNYEFDICAFDSERENILLWEIKWTNKKIDNSVLEKLKEKSKYIKDFKNITFILVSKNWFTDEILRQKSDKLILLNLLKVEI